MNAKRLLCQSVDVKRHKNRAFWLAACWGGLLFVNILIAFVTSIGGPVLLGSLFALARRVCGFIVIYDLFKIRGIVRRHKRVFFAECTLAEFGCANGHYYFKVDISTDEGTYHTCTNAIYSDSSIHADFNDWKNKRVIVAYDREKDIAIVIDIATEELRKRAGLS